MAARQPTPRIPRSLPRGRSHLPRPVVLLSQRERLIEATVEVVGAKGFPATSVADVIRAARVSRTTFYEQFRDKQDCFIAAYEDRGALQFEHVRAAAKRASGSMQRLQAGVRAYLEVLVEEPALARTSLIEVLAAGRQAAASRDSIHARYGDLLRKWHAEARGENDEIPPMPDEVFACAVGGVSDLLAATARDDGTERLPALAPVIVTFLLNVGAVPAGRDLAAALSTSRARRTR
jgi:AcrR family transcriptional regulator